jgi:uncharacterized protein
VTAAPADGLDDVLHFAHAVRRAGVAAGPHRVQSFVAALDHLDVLAPTDVYWAGRLTLCGDPADLDRYDAVFRDFFRRRDPSAAWPTERQRRTAVIAAPIPATPSHDAEPLPSQSTLASASAQEVLRHRDVSELTPDERAQLHRLFTLLVPAASPRRTRRYRPAPRGRIALEPTVRRMLRDGGEPSRLARRVRRHTPRRLVVLLDVSGSMAPYADSLLRFAHAAVRVAPRTTEVFTIGTRLTRITRELRQPDPEVALTSAGSAIPDWSGGTRLGESIKSFLDGYGQRGTARGAVAVICSDGWERSDVTLLGQQVRRLSRLAHRVVWVNPHKGQEGYAPVTAGMVAVLPHVDDLIAGHSFAALERLSRLIGDP